MRYPLSSVAANAIRSIFDVKMLDLAQGEAPPRKGRPYSNRNLRRRSHRFDFRLENTGASNRIRTRPPLPDCKTRNILYISMIYIYKMCDLPSKYTAFSVPNAEQLSALPLSARSGSWRRLTEIEQQIHDPSRTSRLAALHWSERYEVGTTLILLHNSHGLL